jgi:hypothetical protein
VGEGLPVCRASYYATILYTNIKEVSRLVAGRPRGMGGLRWRLPAFEVSGINTN